jgi:integrase
VTAATAPNPSNDDEKRNKKAPSPKNRRRGRDEGSVYWSEDRRRWVAEVTVGYSPNGKRQTKKKYCKTRTEATNALKEMRRDLDDKALIAGKGITVKTAVEDWLQYGLNGKAPKTVELYDYLARVHIIPSIGARKLQELTADDVDKWLASKAKHLSTSVLNKLKSILRRSITRAQKRDKVKRNVVLLCDDVPTGTGGRPSRAFTQDQAAKVLAAAETSPLEAYIVLSLLVGARTEELRALRWDHVDLDGDPRANPPVPPSVMVWRADREGGDVKTKKSRRTLALPRMCVEVLARHKLIQESDQELAGARWKQTGLVFTTTVGTALDASNVRTAFAKVTKAAGLGTDWAPRDMRHTFVSVLSANGVKVEDIARLVGHKGGSRVTEEVYRQEIRPMIEEGAQAMDRIFPNPETRA